MNLLLDTCVFIWLAQEPARISRQATKAIDDPQNALWLSHASIWEVNLKHLSGKLTLPETPRLWFSRQLSAWGVKDLSLDLESIHSTSELAPLHKDPFDRLLVAQAQTHQYVLVSPDDHFPPYGVKVIW